MLANVSIDTSLDLSSDVSIDLSGDESTPTPFRHTAFVSKATPRVLSDLELESLSSRASAVSPPGGVVRRDSQKEALTPAKLKPAKERSNTHTKEVESGDVDSRDDSTGSTPEEYSTPSAENIVFVDSLRKRTVKPEASVVRPTPVAAATATATPPATSQLQRSQGGHRATAQSFTIHTNRHTPDSARAAGIPVVTPRRASVGERSSSDGSDQELHKIHADHRDHETKDSFFLHVDSDATPRSSGEILRPTTLNMRGSACTSARGGARAVGEGDDTGDQTRLSLVEQFQRGKGAAPATSPTVKRTTFAALPNQTTWQECALKNQQTGGGRDTGGEDGEVQPLASELLGVRMRLVEQRRQIELGKRRAEMQWSKQREQLGKQAFIQVISKGKPTADDLVQQEADTVLASKPPVPQGVVPQGVGLQPSYGLCVGSYKTTKTRHLVNHCYLGVD